MRAPRKLRSVGLPIGLLVGLSGLAACAHLPEPLAPARAGHPASELVRNLAGEDLSHLDFTQDALLVRPDGSTVVGRDAIQSWLLADTTASLHSFEFFTHRVYRCGADDGLEQGTYRARVAHGRTTQTGGRWQAVWRRSGGGDWQIAEGRMLPAGDLPPPAGPECHDIGDEVAASARFTASIQGAPFGFYTVDPHRDLEHARGWPERTQSTARPGVVVSASYRTGAWLALGGIVGTEPRFRSQYRSYLGRGDYLESDASFVAATVGYQGRNVTLDAGPAWVRSSWQWHRPTSDLPRPGSAHSGIGAVIDARATLPLRSDLGLELLVQQRFFGSDEVPDTEGLLRGSRSGLFLGLGVAVRRTAR